MVRYYPPFSLVEIDAIIMDLNWTWENVKYHSEEDPTDTLLIIERRISELAVMRGLLLDEVDHQ